MPRNQAPDNVMTFAGLYRDDLLSLSGGGAERIAARTVEDNSVSFSNAVRQLDRADTGNAYWELPEEVAEHLAVEEFNAETPDGIEAVETVSGAVLVKANGYNSVYSPDKCRQLVTGDGSGYDDPLWNIPTQNYSIINPSVAYEKVEEVVDGNDLGESMFGTIREYKGGGEVYMDILFDAHQIDYNDEDPIVLGVRSGYDFFGDTTLFFEGFAQDRQCSNSIRAVTDREVIRHTGDSIEERIEEAVVTVFEQLEVMTDRLAELIEMAQEIEVDMLDLNFSEVFDHDDDTRAFYQLLGFPQYLAREAANHARSRAENSLSPSMTALWDGATYALTHHYQGGEDTSRSRDLIDTANDLIYNPSLSLDGVSSEYEQQLHSDTSAAESATDESAVAIEDFSRDVQEMRDEFETRNEELRQSLLAE